MKLTVFERFHRAQQIPGLTAPQRGVLVALVTHADDLGWCYPSIATIAEYTALDERTVRRALPGLAAVGIILIQPQPGRLNGYHVLWDLWPARAPKLNDPGRSDTPDTVAPRAERHPGQTDRTPRAESPGPRAESPDTPGTVTPEGAIEVAMKRPGNALRERAHETRPPPSDFVELMQHDPRRDDIARRLVGLGVETVDELCAEYTLDRLWHSGDFGEDRAKRVRKALRRCGLDLADPNTTGPPARAGPAFDLDIDPNSNLFHLLNA